MERRDFLRQMTLTLAAAWTAGRLLRPWPARAAAPDLRLALLADAHLKSGDDRRAEAQALARAVAEIKVLSPPPDLAIFAGDLAHQGRADALDLGKEILADLPAPLLAVRGEGDHGPRESAWGRRFGEPRFSVPCQGAHLIGLDAVLTPTPRGPVFELGPAQRRWLAAALAALDPATPLIVVSHAPLARLFHPWQQWTEDAPEIVSLLSRFRQVLCLHGHVHGAGVGNGAVRGQGPKLSKGDQDSTFYSWSFSENRKLKTENHLSLPATAWPRPQAVQGTPAAPRPGLRPHGCGWALLALSSPQADFQPHLWRA
jgi:Icc protein